MGLAALAVHAGPGVTVYDAIPSPLPGNVGSLGFEARSTKEVGDKITLGSGPRILRSVDLLLSSWACQGGAWQLGTCSTAAGATFTHPITLNIYREDGVTLIGSVTQTFTIPYRPSANPVCSGGRWSLDGTAATCFNGLAHVVTFDSPALTALTLPETFVFGIAYNTNNHGYSRLGVPGPYDSLNVGLRSYATYGNPSIGTDATGMDGTGGAYQNSTWAGAYCGGTGPVGTFRLDSGCWGNGIGVRFATASPVVLAGFSKPVRSLPSVNKAKAGRNIPLKFSVANADGSPVTNLASVNVAMTPVACPAAAPGAAEADEDDDLDSRLKNKGEGRYHLNVKTDKQTQGCQLLTLTLPDTYVSTPARLEAIFEFR